MTDQKIEKEIKEHIKISKLLLNMIHEIAVVSKTVVETISGGNRIFLFGNGGSAADAQHIAAEISGRFLKERQGLAAIALTTDTSVITAIANDYGYDKIFSRQVEALAQPNDLLIGISTSGNSINVINGLMMGNRIKCKTIAITGCDGGKVKSVSDFSLIVNSKTTARIQEMHILIGHILCSAIDENY